MDMERRVPAFLFVVDGEVMVCRRLNEIVNCGQCPVISFHRSYLMDKGRELGAASMNPAGSLPPPPSNQPCLLTAAASP
jgi:hypothetical protein